MADSITPTQKTQKMPKTFDFAEAEGRLYTWWEQNGWFQPESAPPDAEPFVISIPPPNVTGALHIGHALFVTLEDLMIRHARMGGKAALWVPGTDHAGIATQLQVERALRAEGTSRQEVGYDAFVARTWAWVEEHGGTITTQLRQMGASCDWTRQRFTLDDGLSRAVAHVFRQLWDAGLIYRGTRLVNWSPGLQTAVSDVEVETAEEQGKLYIFNYPVEGGGSIPVATTRPETILGDTAVCVHPDDPRYQHLVGQHALVPVLGRRIPIIADTYVDMAFGTGALKITPAHDFNDYDIARRHGLPMINIMNKDATLNDHAGPFAGQDRFAARANLWQAMADADLTVEVRDHTSAIPRSQRGGEIVEPLLSEQWFLRMRPLADKALAAVRAGHIRFVPDRFEKVFYHWLDNIEDWCISRQLWWGHRIPVWYGPEGAIHVGEDAPADGGPWTPERDVLDTWFSSGLWPFSTLGWPEDTPDMRRYYPTSVLETGYDILFFWVARMIMMGLWFTDQPPFHTVYLHGLVRDAQGRKISKTLGNTIDPIDLVKRFGADPLRYTLVTSGTPGNDVNLDPDRVEANFRFVNKLWQIANFVTSNQDRDLPPGPPDPSDDLDLPTRWILSRAHRLIDTVTRLFDGYNYGEAGRQLYEFLWHELADWSLEASKQALYEGDDDAKTRTLRALVHVLDVALPLLHPFMPFVTEEIWRYLPNRAQALIVTPWPTADARFVNDQAEADMALMIDLVRGIRLARADYAVEPARRLEAYAAPGGARAVLAANSFLFARLCNISTLHLLADDAPAPDQAATVPASDTTLYLPLAGMIDVAAECERLAKLADKLAEQIARAEAMLGNEQFVARARADVVARERDKLASLHAEAAQTAQRRAQLCG